MKTDYEILDYVEGAGKPVPVDALRAYIGDGADAKIADMRRAGLLKTASAGFFESGKATYALGPAAVDLLHKTRADAKQLRFTRRLAIASLIVSIIAVCIAALALVLQWTGREQRLSGIRSAA